MPEEEPIRVRLPEGKQVLGIVEELLGASRFRVSCKDGHTRICRIPGKFRKRANISVGDIVLVEPWDVESEEKGDILWIYTKTHANWLRQKGYI
ncbi:MAG: translation initiation factor eIF-1A [Candidatus Aenigmatarchaeota archaeon]|nr:MAG: translation initiation factor eIF-1A [Candidatus Aenigmarchaeota archaeon]